MVRLHAVWRRFTFFVFMHPDVFIPPAAATKLSSELDMAHASGTKLIATRYRPLHLSTDLFAFITAKAQGTADEQDASLWAGVEHICNEEGVVPELAMGSGFIDVRNETVRVVGWRPLELRGRGIPDGAWGGVLHTHNVTGARAYLSSLALKGHSKAHGRIRRRC